MSILKAVDVRKVFSQGAGRDQESLEILKGVSLEVDKPETIAIMGRSGCGKSTFISLLAGLDSATSGKIEILGQELSSLSSGALNTFRAQNIGIIFQQFHLLDHLTALENVRLPIDLNRTGGQNENGDARAKEVLEKVGLGHRLDHFPETMSRGEQQRVAIARVLVMKPALLLADEPTGSLDLKTGREVIDLLFNIVETEKIALVMATHDLKLAERCQRHLAMDSGRLAPGFLQ